MTSESSIGSNLRRVEALTGLAAYQQLVDVRAGLDQLGRLLKVPGPEVPARVEGLLERIDTLEGELDTLRSQRRGELAIEFAAGRAKEVGDGVIARGLGPRPRPKLAANWLGIRDRLGPRSVVVVGSSVGGKGR